MRGKWYSMLLGAKDDFMSAKRSNGSAGKGSESTLQGPDSGTENTGGADTRPSEVSLVEEYRGQVNTRSAGEYTILKVAQMLQSEHMRSLPGQAKRAAILVALQAAGVKVADVIDDAMQRSEVLANAEHAREKALRDFEMRKEEANRKVLAMVQSLVAEYDARMQRTKEVVGVEKQKLAEWRRMKTEEEQRITDALAYLTNGQPPSVRAAG